MVKKRMLCDDERDRLLGARRVFRRRNGRAAERVSANSRPRVASAAFIGGFLLLGSVFAADPITPTEPAAPLAPTGGPAIPGYGPGEGLPTEGSPTDLPQMELIPPGIVPLQPVPNLPGLNLGSVPLVQTAQGVDLKSLKYKVSKFNIKYGPVIRPPNPRLPPAPGLLNKPVVLGMPAQKDGGLVGPGAGARDIPITLSQVKTAEMFSGDALQAIYVSLVEQINKLGIYGVFVVVDPDQIDPSTGEDKRKNATDLTLLVYASEVRQVRTIVKPVAKWPFKVASTTINDPKYVKITTHSPLKPPAAKDKPGSLLYRASLQDYLDRINRFPGRRVDVAVTAAGDNAGVILDYIVHTEFPPIFLFDQTSNTGTQASGTWRTRLGAELRQLTGLDDTLDVSFETSLTSSTYSAFGSYQITPLFPDLLKFKVYGGYGKFLAEDVGFDAAQFIGKSATIGLLGIYTPFYFKGFPLDLILGAEYKYVDIADVGSTFPTEGKTSFLLPIIGASTERTTELYSAFGSLQIEPNLPGLAGTSNTQVQNMGRFDVSTDFVLAKYSMGISMFLEPIIFRKTWRAYSDEPDPTKRKAYWKKVSLAHEVAFLLHGQYTFADKRLIPQFEDVLGGFASVRGYPEAFTSGDDTVILNAEYRFHALRKLKPYDTDVPDDPTKPPPPPPRVGLRPPTILGRPDIDLILRLFYDVGYAENNNLQAATEVNRTLMSVGAGVEVQIFRYLNLRLDCGVPLLAATEKTSRPVEAYSPRLTFVGVVSY